MNTRLGKLYHIKFDDCVVDIAAHTTLAVVRAGLAIFPFRSICSYTYSTTNYLLGIASKRSKHLCVTPKRLAWAVCTAAGRMPVKTTCLPQALAGQILLAMYGYDSKLNIGVTSAGTDRLAAHAWIERNGDVLVGNLPDLTNFQPLPTFGG